MTYELIYTRRAVKDIKRLDNKARQRVKSDLEKFRDDPFQSAVKLTSPEIGTYRLRIGPYRVVFDVEYDKIIILRVAHRRDTYRSV